MTKSKKKHYVNRSEAQVSKRLSNPKVKKSKQGLIRDIISILVGSGYPLPYEGTKEFQPVQIGPLHNLDPIFREYRRCHPLESGRLRHGIR